MFRGPDSSDEDNPITIKGYLYADGNPVMNRNPDGKGTLAVANEGFAVYDGYKSYKESKNKKLVALLGLHLRTVNKTNIYYTIVVRW